MMKRYLSFLFISILSISSAFAQISGPGGGGGGSLISGVSPISGCSPGQFLYNNSGVLGCQSGSGGITGPGTTVSGDLVTWNSTTGTAIADSGFSISGGTLTGPATLSLTLLGASGHGLLLGSNGGATWTIPYNSSNLYPSTDNVSQFGLATNRVASGFFVNLGSTSAGINNIYLQGSSTGTDLLQSGNSSVTNRTITIPVGTVNDTLALLGASQTFSGAVTYSGTTQFSGAGVASPAINTTSLMGGTTAPTTGTNAGTLWIGGNYAAPSLSTTGQALISVTAAGGLSLQGNPSVTFYSANGTQQAGIIGGQFQARAFGNLLTNRIFYSTTAPTWNAGFGNTTTVGTQNGTTAFQVTIPASPSGSTGTVNLPSATTEWNCYANDKTNATTVVVAQTGWATNTATFTAFSRTTGAAVTWTTGDVIEMSCSGL